MKRKISFLLAVIFALTAVGVSTVFGSIIGAGAEFYDYFNYTPIPGLSAFSEQGIKDSYQPNYSFLGFDSEFMPEEASVDKVAKFRLDTPDIWSAGTIRTFSQETFAEDNDSANWQANLEIDDTDIFGDSGLSFSEATGFTFWVGLNGTDYQGTIKLTLMQVPAKGPYYQSGELIDLPRGLLYENAGKRTDSDGYVYFDFKTDFHQIDWWSTDEDGNNQYDKGDTPVPEKAKQLINAFQIRINDANQTGDIVSIGDFRICYDTRIHTDELDEQLTAFNSLNPDAYTEDSYIEASDVYLEAYEVYMDAESYTQREIDLTASKLRKAIQALVPLFHARFDGVELVGFEAWNDEQLDRMSELGLDTAIKDDQVFPARANSSVMVMANAVDGEPTYGWSWFTSGSSGEEGSVAIGNPFALKDGSAPLSEASGIRFWIKWDESLLTPLAIRLGVGSSTSNVYFECDDYQIELPETEGYIGAAWTVFYDLNGEADIYDYIDELDYITIFLEDAVGIYYISDLHAFEWNVSSADFVPLQKKINDTYTYMSGLNRDEWYYTSWDRVMQALVAGEEIIGQYGITDEDVQVAIDNIDSAVAKLVPIGNDDMTHKTRLELEAIIDVADDYWKGNVTPASYRLLLLAMDTGKEILQENAKEKDAIAAKNAIREAIAGLVPITGEEYGDVFSVEDMSTRDFNRANAHRHADALYALVDSSEMPAVPEGYEKAVKMTTTEQLLKNYTSTGTRTRMTFKVFTSQSQPLKVGNNGENVMFGDLSGADGIRVWVSISDMSKVTQECVYFSLCNTYSAPHFGWNTDNCLFPTTGSGWVYIPWDCFEIPDKWYEGQPLDPKNIYHWSIMIGGVWEEVGLSAYATGIEAYKGSETTWNAPGIKNITDGQVIDISETGSFTPDWAEGSALITEKFSGSTYQDYSLYFTYGNSLDTNGEYSLTVINGDKEETVSFTIVGGKETSFTVPVVSGVEEGGEYEKAIVSWDIGTATLNGKDIANGSIILDPGSYTLVVTNGDKQTTVNFTVIAIAPPAEKVPFIKVSVTGYEYGAPTADVSLNILSPGVTAVTYITDRFSWDSKPVPEELLLAGKDYYAIFSFKAEEGYDISDMTADKVTIEGVVPVEIFTDSTAPGMFIVGFKLPVLVEPGPDVMKGDPDGDGMITVADALYTLRIAAQLTEGTNDDLLVVDTDGDGSITVADALAILRVAAQLADSL